MEKSLDVLLRFTDEMYRLHDATSATLVKAQQSLNAMKIRIEQIEKQCLEMKQEQAQRQDGYLPSKVNIA